MTLIDRFSRFYTDLSSMKIDELGEIYDKSVVFIDPIAHHEGIKSVEIYFSRLLKNAQHCQFEIHRSLTPNDASAVVMWTMTYNAKRLNQGRTITVDGMTYLDINAGKITLHRDYYDLGQMVYEHVPVLGRCIKSIKRKMG